MKSDHAVEKLYFRDIGSSSGTFLNKLRLSPSGKESRPYLLRSGDVIQLGIDYHGKKEDIYKCIMMKIIIQGKEADIKRKANIERLNNAIKELISAASPNTKDSDQVSSVECCICLNTLAPYQALFLAPCTHCFHYKCVHPLLGGGIMFLCPLCRQVANLEATVSTDNLFEKDEDLVLESKRSLYHSERKISVGAQLNGEVNDKKLTENKKSKSNQNLNNNSNNKSNNKPPKIKIEKQKSNSSLNELGNKLKSIISPPYSVPAMASDDMATTSSKKKDSSPTPTTDSPVSGKKSNRKGAFKSLITTTFSRRKRSNSTHVPNATKITKNKNVKSTGNINSVVEEEKSQCSLIEPMNVFDTTTGRIVGRLREESINNEDDTGDIPPIDDDPLTANPLSSPEGKSINNDELFYRATRENNRLAQ